MSPKNKKTLVILSLILALLVIGGALMMILPRLKEKDSLPAAVSLGEPVELTYNCGGGNEMITFRLENGVWIYSADPEAPVIQNGITSIANAMKTFAPIQVMEAADTMAAYGLEEPEYTVTATDESGRSLTVNIGKISSDTNRFALSSQHGGVCIISQTLPLLLSNDLYTLLEIETIAAVNEEDIAELKLAFDGKTVSFRQEEGLWYYLDKAGAYVPEEEFSAIGSDGESHTARKYLNDVSASFALYPECECVNYKADDAALAEMGFDSCLTVTFTGTGGVSLDLLVGDSFIAEDGTEYSFIKLSNLEAVFALPAVYADAYFEAVNILG